jgi:hypothetical protein
MTLKEHFEDVVSACKAGANTPTSQMLLMSKILQLQAALSADGAQAPPDVFDGLDDEGRILMLHSFLAMMVMALSDK